MTDGVTGRAWRLPLARFALGCLLAAAATRFMASGVLPAAEGLRGDFSVTFPSEYFAQLRPEWPAPTVWGAARPADPQFAGLWYYGPMMHFITVPLFVLPAQSAIAPVWAAVNVFALGTSFLLLVRTAGSKVATPLAVLTLMALWMGFQPLVNCLAQGNIEIVELALLIVGLASLQSGRSAAAGIFTGCSAMAKYLPAGFVVWMAIRGCRRSLVAAAVTIAAIAACTALTLGWSNSTVFRNVPRRALAPPAGFHELSITSVFLHRTATLDPRVPELTWTPPERKRQAQIAGLATSAALGLAYTLLIWRRRRTPILPPEFAVLFLLMLLLPPWNHDYYYVFAVAPFSIVFFTALASPRNRIPVLSAAALAYVMISPPIPYSIVDGLGWFADPFAHVLNLNDIPTFGALLLLGIATYQWLATPPDARSSAPRRESTTV